MKVATSSRSVLLIGNFLSNKLGTRGLVEDLADELRRSEWTVYTASNIINRWFRMINILHAIWKYRRSYGIAGLDVYSGAAFYWSFLASIFLRLLNKPYVLNLQGGKLPDFARKRKWLVNYHIKRATSVVTTSHYLMNEFSVIRNDIRVIENAVNVFHQYPFKLRTTVEPKLVWLRAFAQIYSPLTAVQALSRLASEFPTIELTMFGPNKNDGTLSELQCWALEAGILERIRLPGAISKESVSQHLEVGDIFLNTTTAESFGVSVVEAAALGMCIVTTNVGELPYIWKNNHNALLIPPNDPQAMAEAIRRILTEPGLAERLSHNARARAEQFDWSLILPQWEALLTNMIERHKNG